MIIISVLKDVVGVLFIIILTFFLFSLTDKLLTTLGYKQLTLIFTMIINNFIIIKYNSIKNKSELDVLLLILFVNILIATLYLSINSTATFSLTDSFNTHLDIIKSQLQ